MDVYFTRIHLPYPVQFFISSSVIYLALLYNPSFRYFHCLPLYCYSLFLLYRFADSFIYISCYLTFNFGLCLSLSILSFRILHFLRFFISPLHLSYLPCPCYLIVRVARGGPHKVSFGHRPFHEHNSWNQETKSHASAKPNPGVHHCEQRHDSGQVTCSLC